MLTKEMATQQIQAEAPARWVEMTPQEREDAVRERMNTIRRSEDRYLNAIPPEPTTGTLEGDLQAANARRLSAQEYAQAEVSESIEAQAPEGAVEFWTWWAKKHPGEQPLIDAWVTLWPVVVQEWLNHYSEAEWTMPWRHQNQWTAFNWDNHRPEFSMIDGEPIGLDEQIEALVEGIASLAQEMLTNDLRWITGAGEGPSTQEGFSRTSKTWDDVNRSLRRYESGRFPLELLPQELIDEAWETIISEWDMDDVDPWWNGFETEIPAWMVTWLENHPDNTMHQYYDTTTRQPKDQAWQSELQAHKKWKAAQG